MQSVASLLSAGALELPVQSVRLPPEQNVSAGHCSHAPPDGPENPSLQMQSVASLLPTGDAEFASQFSRTPPEQN
eukprot:2346902-Rhodomonas_salina.1